MRRGIAGLLAMWAASCGGWSAPDPCPELPAPQPGDRSSLFVANFENEFAAEARNEPWASQAEAARLETYAVVPSNRDVGEFFLSGVECRSSNCVIQLEYWINDRRG